jgi:hypothetical protein
MSNQRPAQIRRLGSVIGLMILFACSDHPTGSATAAPAIGKAVVTANEHNVLSAVASVAVSDADSIAVVFRDADGVAGTDTSAAVPVRNGHADISVLGLRPSTTYHLRLIAWAGDRSTTGDVIVFSTGALPADLPSYTAAGADPSPGFVVFASGPYAIAIDNSGRIVWYRRFSHSAGLAFVAQANGRYFARPTSADTADSEHWVELDALGNVVHQLPCAGGLVSRPHDLIVQLDESYWLMCDDTRTVDLSREGGQANAKVTGTAIQHIGADGRLLFSWSPFDHLDITDLDASKRAGTAVNWTHGNALDLDSAGNIVVSFRNLEEVTRINGTTGAVLSRLGGRKNQFTISGSTNPPFAQQHSARVSSANEIILLDNLGNPSESRAERYTVDWGSRTARLTGSFGSSPGVVTAIGGSVQSLPGGRMLVSFGTAGRVEEYDAAGNVVWRIQGNPGYVFRAQRITSLYAPGAGTTR